MQPIPRHDFYQTDSQVIVAVYLKGYAAQGVKEAINVAFEPYSVTVSLPALNESQAARQIKYEPLYGSIQPEGSSFRVQSSKIELNLIKSSSVSWLSILSPNPVSSAPSNAIPSSSKPVTIPSNPLPPIESDKSAGKKPNWDKVVESELAENEESSDPNAGGDTALQKMFAQIYAGANEDTKRAMIKSFTESGGTTLSTDWSTIGKERTPVRPPDGMFEQKY